MIEFGRKKELKRLLSLRGNGKIKVVTGLRRCGKSYLLYPLFTRELLLRGISSADIVELNLVGKDYGIDTPEKLSKAIKESVGPNTKFLIVDEAQRAGDGFAGVFLALLSSRPDVDCYITGSNSDILSKDIVRQFKGKAKEVKVSPLTFAEIREAIPDYPFEKYLRFGGLPLILNCEDDESRETELRDLWENTYLSDIHDRFKGKLISERAQKGIIIGILSNITSPTSEKRITKTILGGLHQTKAETAQMHAEIGDLIQAARDSFLLIGFEQIGLEPSNEWMIENSLKNYCVDVGLLRAISKSYSIDGDALENAVFLRIISKGCETHGEEIMRNDGTKGEVDFVYEKAGKTHFVQVAFLLSETNRHRELSFLEEKAGDSLFVPEMVCHECRIKDVPDGIHMFVGEEFFL